MSIKTHKRKNSLLGKTTDYRSKDDSTIKIRIFESPFLVKPVKASKWTLEELLAGINKNNIHQEVNTGFAVGNEIW